MVNELSFVYKIVDH